MVLGKTFRVWKKSQPRSVLLECKTISETLLFESGAIAVLTPEECEHVKKQYSKVIDAHACLGVLNVNLGNKHVKYLFLVTGCSSVGRLYGSEIQRITDVFTLFLEDSVDPDYVSEVRKLLCSGTFYFTSQGSTADSAASANSGDFEAHVVDLSLSAQCRYHGRSLDDRFIWNQNLHYLPTQFGVDTSQWLVRISCGSVEVRTVYAGSNKARVTLMSRLSCSRAGTRFNVRGVDDYGEVANFVETEQAISFQKTMVSFVQLRGSIPLFWEQPGFQTGTHKVKMSRGFDACRPAFRRHVDGLRSRYGSQLFLSLLNIKESEALLSTALQDQVKDYGLPKTDLDIVTFDYHHNCRGGSQEKLSSVLLRDVAPHLKKHGFFSYVDGNVKSLQNGTVRTNCMDCLDRTNAVQTFLGLEILKEQLPVLGIENKASVVSRFHDILREIWKINGDNISKIYAGTGAMEGKAKMGKLMDGAKSVARTVRNNFLDGSKQEAIDILLTGNAFVGDLGGRARALLAREDALGSSALKAHLCDRHEEFVERSPLRVCVGTWNVNGGRQFRSIAYKNQSMHDWLLDARKLDSRKIDSTLPTYTGPLTRPRGRVELAEYQRLSSDGTGTPFEPLAGSEAPQIFAIGFEELVDLNATNIVSTSSSNKKEWGAELQRVVSRDQEYALLTCEQLVGVCLYVFIQPRLLPHVRDVAIDSVKTGMHGKAGNKGGVAVRFLLYSTSFCFVCAHLAAGQSHAAERAADYAEITKRVVFPMGRTIESHDYVFWCGDFNYRIDLPIDDVKQLVASRDFEPLQKADQLRKQMKEAKVFQGYSEGVPNFIPTYKYDLFSDDFDTSEKSRIPAWTDRVLWKHKAYPSFVDIVDSEDPDSDVTYSSSSTEEDSRVSVSSLSISSNEPSCPFNHGSLAYYGRAELKISDHRPVVAVVDVEVEKVNLSRRNATHKKVEDLLGPADPTIIVHPHTGSYLDVELLTDHAQEFGIVVLIRLVGDDAYITFHDSRAALRSLAMSGTQVGDVVVDVTLRSDCRSSIVTDTNLLDSDIPSIPINVLAPGGTNAAAGSLKVGQTHALHFLSDSIDQAFVATPEMSRRATPSDSDPRDLSTAADQHSDTRSNDPSESGRMDLQDSSERPPSPSSPSRTHSHSPLPSVPLDQLSDDGSEGAKRIPPPIPPTARTISPVNVPNDVLGHRSHHSSCGSLNGLNDQGAMSAPDSLMAGSLNSLSSAVSASTASAAATSAAFEDIDLDDDSCIGSLREQPVAVEDAFEGLPTKSIVSDLSFPPARPAQPPRQTSLPTTATAPPRPSAQPGRPSRPPPAAHGSPQARLASGPPSRPNAPPSRPGAPPNRPGAPPSRPDAPPGRPDGPPSRPARPARPNPPQA
ncbi:synaptojanin-1-like [Sycon ciliatum]|uniref:synaptojanin-1-like n=1 Tax=Sycon ciliatum TaxID=27933 RepID=UPI0031F6DCDC